MKKTVKTIALIATCMMAGTGYMHAERSYFTLAKESIESLYQPDSYFCFGCIHAGLQALLDPGKRPYQHAAITLGLSSIPLLSQITEYDKNPHAILCPPTPLSKTLGIMALLFGDDFDKKTKKMTPSIGKTICGTLATVASVYEWGMFAYNFYQTWKNPQANQ
jgi:hypothetical protein